MRTTSPLTGLSRRLVELTWLLAQAAAPELDGRAGRRESVAAAARTLRARVPGDADPLLRRAVAALPGTRGSASGDLAAVLTTAFQRTAAVGAALHRLATERDGVPPDSIEVLRDLAWVVERALDRALTDKEAATVERIVHEAVQAVRAGLAA